MLRLKMKIKLYQTLTLSKIRFYHEINKRYKVYKQFTEGLQPLFEKFIWDFHNINFIELQLLFLSVKVMKNHVNLQFNLFQNHRNDHQSRIDKSPRAKNQIHFCTSAASDEVLDFHFSRYPFRNKQSQGNLFLKTTLPCRIEERRLQKLMNITHPNLINVLKIVRGHPRQPSCLNTAPYFSFYYESVPYSLKRMAALSESQPKIMSELARIIFAKILKELAEYLMMQGIFHEVKLDDIGVDQFFNIKIYLSPSIACGLDKNQSTKSGIIKNNESLVNWWRTTFFFSIDDPLEHVLNIPRVESIENLDKLAAEMIKSNKSSLIAGESSQIMGQGEVVVENIDQMKISMPEEKIKKLNMSNNITKPTTPNDLTSSINQMSNNKKAEGFPSNDLKCSQKTFQSDLSKLSQLQQTKMKKIHEQIEKIKKNVKKSSMDNKLRKQSDHIILQKMKAFNKTLNGTQRQIFQSAKLQKAKANPESIQIQPNKYNCEAIQQNINCINIYNHSPVGNGHKNIRNVPVFSYNIIPSGGTNQNTLPHRLSQRNIEPTRDRSNTDNGSNTSFQIDDHKINANNITFRHSLEPSDDHPILNLPKADPFPSKSQQIKVTTKNVTESAGPLQFKNIINKVIKPQFMAKKSNIYEDPQEDESQHQISKQQYTMKQSQKLPTSKQQSIYNNKKLQGRQQVKHYNFLLMPRSKQNNIKNESSNEVHNSLGKSINLIVQKSQTNLLKKAKTHQDSLNSRIKQVVLKTKNAIQLLNRVKSSKSINRRNVSPS